MAQQNFSKPKYIKEQTREMAHSTSEADQQDRGTGDRQMRRVSALHSCNLQGSRSRMKLDYTQIPCCLSSAV